MQTPTITKPVRQNTTIIDSSDLMGPGSWVKVRTLTVNETNRFMKLTRQAQKLARDEAASQDVLAEEGMNPLEREVREIVLGAVLDWNWVDDAGEPLPSPHNNITIVDDLTQAEMHFLMDGVRGIAPEKKASKKKTSR